MSTPLIREVFGPRAADARALTLSRAGSSDQHARLIIELFDAHKADRIDVEANAGERAFGATSLDQAIAEMVASASP
jgi:NAD(P)H dehydrogenase (quinone)